jgi:hypothetical protein
MLVRQLKVSLEMMQVVAAWLVPEHLKSYNFYKQCEKNCQKSNILSKTSNPFHYPSQNELNGLTRLQCFLLL